MFACYNIDSLKNSLLYKKIIFLIVGLPHGFSWLHSGDPFQAGSGACPLEAHSVHLPLSWC